MADFSWDRPLAEPDSLGLPAAVCDVAGPNRRGLAKGVSLVPVTVACERQDMLLTACGAWTRRKSQRENTRVINHQIWKLSYPRDPRLPLARFTSVFSGSSSTTMKLAAATLFAALASSAWAAVSVTNPR